MEKTIDMLIMNLRDMLPKKIIFLRGLDAVEFYKPTDRGLEKKILEKIEYLRSLDKKYIEKNRKKND